LFSVYNYAEDAIVFQSNTHFWFDASQHKRNPVVAAPYPYFTSSTTVSNQSTGFETAVLISLLAGVAISYNLVNLSDISDRIESLYAIFQAKAVDIIRKVVKHKEEWDTIRKTIKPNSPPPKGTDKYNKNTIKSTSTIINSTKMVPPPALSTKKSPLVKVKEGFINVFKVCSIFAISSAVIVTVFNNGDNIDHIHQQWDHRETLLKDEKSLQRDMETKRRLLSSNVLYGHRITLDPTKEAIPINGQNRKETKKNQ